MTNWDLKKDYIKGNQTKNLTHVYLNINKYIYLL